jgi:hypothetical protein
LLVSWWVICQRTGQSIWRFVAQCVPPALASLVMVGAVLAVRWAWPATGLHLRGLDLAVEVAAGGVAYVVAALVVARRTSQKFLSLLQRAWASRRGS